MEDEGRSCNYKDKKTPPYTSSGGDLNETDRERRTRKMEELREGYVRDKSPEENRAKINEIIGWINAQENKEKERNKESKEDERLEEILKGIRECLRVYGDREESLRRYPFNCNFYGLYSLVEVMINPCEGVPNDFDMTVRVRSR